MNISSTLVLSMRDLCINMNNHQNAIFHQITNFLKTPLALLGVDLKNFQFNKICHFANHPYLCKGLYEYCLVLSKEILHHKLGGVGLILGELLSSVAVAKDDVFL